MSRQHTIPVYDAACGSWAISIRRQPLNATELASRYDRIAHRWHRLSQRLGLPRAYEALLANVPQPTSGAAPNGTLRVLDCGAGTGEFGLAYS